MTELTKLVLAYIATKANLISVDNTVTQTTTFLTSNQAIGTYQWFNCDTNTPISGETSQSFTPLTNGNYAVEVTNGSCTEMSMCINFSVLSMEEFQPNEIKVYPNPVDSLIKVDNFTESKIDITINNISGKVVRKTNSRKAHIEIEFDSTASGVYFVNVKSKTKASTYKIVKE